MPKESISKNNTLIKNIFVWVMLLFLTGLVGFGGYEKFKSKPPTEEERATALANNPLSVDISDDVIPNNDKAETPIQKLAETFTVPPSLQAKAYLVMDVKNDQILLSQNELMQLPPASLTKIMTAIIAIEDYNLSRSVVVPQKCVDLNGAMIGFKANEVFTLEDLLYGLLVKSGADAACAIANISSEAEFLERMNAKAKEIGLDNTVFQNEIGFDAENNQLTSVEDIRKLSLYALNISTFRKIVGTRNIVIKNLSAGNTYPVQTTNDLLYTIPGSAGIKTGTTDKAGQCLSYLYQNRDREILIVILGSQDRFKDTTALLNWANGELDYRAQQL